METGKLRELRPDALLRAIQACSENGERLLKEADWPLLSPSRFYLAMIAQEEFAKAFMLYLVKEQTIPFNRYIVRAMKDHICKQLVGIIMDYVIMHWDDIEELKAMIEEDWPDDAFPAEVASAMNLLRFEKISTWECESSNSGWFWDEDPIEDPSALRVFEGKRDLRKQDALYVRIGSTGRFAARRTRSARMRRVASWNAPSDTTTLSNPCLALSLTAITGAVMTRRWPG